MYANYTGNRPLLCINWAIERTATGYGGAIRSVKTSKHSFRGEGGGGKVNDGRYYQSMHWFQFGCDCKNWIFIRVN